VLGRFDLFFAGLLGFDGLLGFETGFDLTGAAGAGAGCETGAERVFDFDLDFDFDFPACFGFDFPLAFEPAAQGPRVSPCARCAGTAFWLTVIVTPGFDFDPVR
jgi:hypothetical protein